MRRRVVGPHLLERADAAAEQPTGVLILDADQRCRSATLSAQAWLAALPGASIARSGGYLPQTVHAVAARASAAECPSVSEMRHALALFEHNRPAAMAAIHLVGRDDAIARIEQRLRGITQRGGALLIRGSAGIGKSALLEFAIEDAQLHGYGLLTTSGVESETKLPFAGLHQLLHPCVGSISSLPGPQRDALLTAFGMLAGEAPSLFLVGLAALSLLADLASDAPLVVVADDAQWLDATTTEVLTFVARRLEADPVVLLAALRDGFDTALLSAGLDQMQLEPLDEATSMELLDVHAPDLGSGIRTRVLQEASGNPLALVELPRALRSKPHVDAQLLPLTERLERAFALRGSDLPARTRTALLAAAADDSADLLEVLAATARVTRSALTTGVFEPAVAAGLLSLHDTRLRFRHPLVRSAVYQSAALSERQSVHRALAEVLIDDPDRRAWHRAAATLGPDSEAAADLAAAARRAQQRGALAVAALAFERAAALSDDARARVHYLLVAAEIGFELGEPSLVGRLLDEAERHVLDGRERVRTIWLREIFSDGIPGDATAIRRLVDSANETLEGADQTLALNLLHAAAVRCWWADPGEAIRTLVVAAVTQAPFDPADPRVLEILALVSPVDCEASVSEGVARVAGSAPLDGTTARLLGFASHATGQFELSFDLLLHAAQGLRTQGQMSLLAQVLVVRAWDAIHTGRLDEALRNSDEGGRLARETSQPVWTAGSGIAQALVKGVRGDYALAEALVAEAEQTIIPLQLSNLITVAQLTRGLVALTDGRYGEAFDLLPRMFDRTSPASTQIESFAAVGYVAEAAVHAGRQDEARKLMPAIEDLGTRTSAPLLHAGLRYARAVLADDAEADELYRAALDSYTGGAFEDARLRLAYGAWLRRRRRVADSRDPLRAARDAFDRVGAIPWGDRARRELRASGERSPARPIADQEPLSPQELQIARLAASGMSNRDIAERLFLSHRTVGSHLYRIFPKLGIASRSELSAALDDALLDQSLAVTS